MMCCVKLSSHTQFHIKIIIVTSLDIETPSLVLSGFVLLYYLFCDVCSDMLTCLLCIMFDFFSNNQNCKKYNQFELLKLLSPTKNLPQLSQNPLLILSLLTKIITTVTEPATKRNETLFLSRNLNHQNGQFLKITTLGLKLGFGKIEADIL